MPALPCLPGLPWERGLLALLELLGLERLLPCLADLLELPVLPAEVELLPGLQQVQVLPDLGLAERAGLLCLLAAGPAGLLRTLLVRRRS